MEFCSFYDAWNYLNNHKLYCNEFGDNDFVNCIDIEVVKVNPDTMEISDNEDENTKVQVWLESGSYDKDDGYYHDLDLDCGGDTFEQAIVNLAELVYKKYDLNIDCKEDMSESLITLLNELAESLKLIVDDLNKNKKEED